MNDSLGREAGDDLPKETAERLRNIQHGLDTIARMGGDVFMLLTDSDNEAEVREVGRHIRRAFEPDFSAADSEVPLDASLGFAIPGDEIVEEMTISDAANAMARTADRALREAKEQSETAWEVYDAGIWGETSRQL